jgi:hypothetical protein
MKPQSDGTQRTWQAKRLIAELAILSSLCLTSACEVLDDIHVDDKDTADVAASAVFRPKAWSTRDGSGGGGIEIAFERHRGDGLQTIDAGHFVTFEGLSVSGPQQIATRAEIDHWDLSYNHLFAFGPYFELEPAAGISYDTTEVNALNNGVPTRRLHLNEDKWGLNVSITPRFVINEYLAVEARIRSNASNGHEGSSTRIPSLVVKPTPNIAIHLGYLFYRQEIAMPEGTSDIEVDFEGPSAALRIAF